MELPQTIRVKISSEAAEFISLTPVVVREMPLRELIETLLGSAGKSPERIEGMLRSGSFVSGGSRFRWEGFTAGRAAMEAILATFPDPDPGRAFSAAACLRAILRGPGARIEIERQAAREHRLFRKSCFWDGLMSLAQAAGTRYCGYSYRDRADRYELSLTPADASALRASAGLLRYSTLEAQVSRAHLDRIELFVERTAAV
ncbi:MAG TPA: hypothetical protein VF767_09020 [Bryobacteraceae bacterium]